MAESELTATYRDVPGFPGYRVGSDGSVWSRGRHGRQPWRRMSPGSSGPYQLVLLWRDGERFPRKVHVLVLEAFVGPRPDGMQCCHGDGNPLNNAASNLRWGTAESNYSDRVVHGTGIGGEMNPKAIITQAIANAIRAEYRRGRGPRIAQAYGVSASTVLDIVKRRTWNEARP